MLKKNDKKMIHKGLNYDPNIITSNDININFIDYDKEFGTLQRDNIEAYNEMKKKDRTTFKSKSKTKVKSKTKAKSKSEVKSKTTKSKQKKKKIKKFY